MFAEENAIQIVIWTCPSFCTGDKVSMIAENIRCFWHGANHLCIWAYDVLTSCDDNSWQAPSCKPGDCIFCVLFVSRHTFLSPQGQVSIDPIISKQCTCHGFYWSPALGPLVSTTVQRYTPNLWRLFSSQMGRRNLNHSITAYLITHWVCFRKLSVNVKAANIEINI